ncbi:5'-3' exoribonuclease pacman isoform X2 [Anticarsia gemmatalis]|uniref:5'-3' exoribonuclease pacman isoform X2 n=1 Tax=Anticarsia gemmatalis TaxID=129554 RepID=UPI003F76EA97
MGVPKFFRYTSERYPCLNELVKQYQIPDFDNMYLDMNGIIHNCSHPDDSNPHFRITEEKIFQDIFHYLTILFQIIKPKKLFFMAIDGVAPRAKMNQQRGRRFRSAREAEKLEEAAKEKGETLPSEKRFDSNCITPGTVFMARLHEQLKYFVKHKISTDPLWSKVKVILSGHETPGEGEHKIMDYIRWSRSQPDYDPNTRHCLYGLDADLIMLGMCTHEPHFALLREEVKFGRTTQRATSPEETNFYLLHLSLLREYLEQEFISIKDNLPFKYDIEKVVDDWVLMGFLVGNDFIPNLPNMHINNDALPLLYKTYMTVLPTLDGYINEAGDLNLARFEVFMQELAKIDKEKFQDTYADLKYFEAKTGRRPNANERREYKPNNDETFNVNVEDIKANKPDDELQALINATQDLFMDDMDEEDGYEETSDEEQNMEMEFILHKKDYYMNKLDYSKVTDEVLADQAEGYVRAIQWNLYYYYKGCPSWCWYYPHHYAPYISDIKGFKDLKIEFELGEPFKPFEQLLAVLPAASKQLLPMPFHDLMTDEDSPIVHYYPINFETDLNGKRNEWEAVVLIPFIDEVNLLSAMEPCYQRLTEEEKKRNSHGPMMVYNWTSQNLGEARAPEYFPPIQECHAVEQAVYRQELEVSESELKRGMLPNAKRDMLFPGFPTMRHLKYQTSLKKGKVKVFDTVSRNENMIVEIIRDDPVEPPLENVAQQMLGKVIWVGWPHLTRAKVISVSNEKRRLHCVDKQNNNVDNYTTEFNQGNLHKQWIGERSTIIEHNMNRLGIELGDVRTIIHAVNLKGFKYVIQDNVKMVQEAEWCAVPCGYALQAVVPDVRAHVIQEGGQFSTPQEAYPPGSHVFLLTAGQHYGSLATVVDSECIKSGRIKVSLTERGEPVPSVHNFSSPYKSAHHAAAACGISPQMLSRITGTVLVIAGERHDRPTESLNKLNIGLNLKFNKKNQEVSGFTRRCRVSNAWSYSSRCIALVRAYAAKFPELFDNLAHELYRDVFFESDLFPDEMGQNKVQEVAGWLKLQEHNSAARRTCGTEGLEAAEMRALADTIEVQLQQLKLRECKLTLQVKWSLLYKPELHSGNIQADPRADYKLYDRVVCAAPHMTVPLGAAGTVTALLPPASANTVRLSDKLNADVTVDVMFDQPFPGALAEDLFDEPRFYRMSPANLINLSYGRKLRGALTTAAPDPYPLMPRNAPEQYQLLTRNASENKPPSNRIASDPKPSANRVASEPKPPSNRIAPEPKPPSNRIAPDPQPLPTRKGPDPLTANTAPTNVLRPNDGHHSAFANYSPPADKAQTPVVGDNHNSSITPTTNGPSEDHGTHLLRSLLRISENEPNQQSKPVTPEQLSNNWRLKTDNAHVAPPQPPQSQRGPPQTNWRTENVNPPVMQQNNGARPPVYNQEWTNNAYKNQPQMPPFPPFGQGFQGPGPSQIPFPQFPNPHFNRNPSTQVFNFAGPRNPDRNAYNQCPPPRFVEQGFPKHLPSVTNNVTLGPSWNQPGGQPKQNARPQENNAGVQRQNSNQHNNADKVNNPFVPLQVQTCQRRTQQPGGPSRKDSGHQMAPRSSLPKPQPINTSMGQQSQDSTSRPMKKKKPRIAANLPFQTE